MRYAVEILLDAAAERLLIDAWNDLRRAGLAKPQTARRPYRPHLSLIVAADLPDVVVSPLMAAIAAAHSTFPLLFTHWGIFCTEQNILFAAPKETPPLTALQTEVYAVVRQAGIAVWHYYDPARWAPHCALTSHADLDGINQALQMLESIRLPLSARAAKLALVDFAAGEELGVWPLCSHQEPGNSEIS